MNDDERKDSITVLHMHTEQICFLLKACLNLTVKTKHSVVLSESNKLLIERRSVLIVKCFH